LLAKTDSGSYRFVVKQVVYDSANASLVADKNQAVVEHSVLTCLYPKFYQVPYCSVPKPIAVLPEIDSYIMEFVEGHLMEEDLRFLHYLANCTKFEELKIHFRHCGRWLRCFQNFSGKRRAKMEALDGTLKRCESRLHLIEKLDDPRCPKGFRSAVERFLQEQIEKLTDAEFQVAGRHGDFGPWNVMIGSKGVTVLDFFGYQEAPLPVDILKMLLKLEEDSLHPANSHCRLDELREHFLVGYGPLPELPKTLVTVCEAMHRICGLYGALSTRSKGFFQRIYRHRRIKANLEWLLKENGSRPLLWPN
jgi:hypothetical protein